MPRGATGRCGRAGRHRGGRGRCRAAARGGAAAGDRGAAGVGVGRLQELATADDWAQVHLTGDLHEVDGLLLVLDAGQVGDDGVALAEDLGLGHAERIDVLADLLDRPKTPKPQNPLLTKRA